MTTCTMKNCQAEATRYDLLCLPHYDQIRDAILDIVRQKGITAPVTVHEAAYSYLVFEVNGQHILTDYQTDPDVRSARTLAMERELLGPEYDQITATQRQLNDGLRHRSNR